MSSKYTRYISDTGVLAVRVLQRVACGAKVGLTAP
jgi:hypothetical protein